MLTLLMAAWCLLALTVIIHAVGLASVLGRVRSSFALSDFRFWPVALLLVRIAWMLILLHLAEMAVWGLFYWWQGCFPDAESCFYFSGITYSTVGYGDLVLPQEWRLLAPLEAMTGILMCGLSTGLFFAVVSKIALARLGAKPD